MRGQIEVAEGVFMDIYDAFVDFKNKFGHGMGILGDIIRDDFTRGLERAQDVIEEFDYLTKNRLQEYDRDYDPGDSEPSSGGSGKAYMSRSDFDRYVNYKMIYDMAKKAGDTIAWQRQAKEHKL